MSERWSKIFRCSSERFLATHPSPIPPLSPPSLGCTVPMNNALLVAVINCSYHLFENISGHDFVHGSLLLLNDIAQIVGHQVHDEAHLVIGLEPIFQMNDTFMVQLLHNLFF